MRDFHANDHEPAGHPERGKVEPRNTRTDTERELNYFAFSVISV